MGLPAMIIQSSKDRHGLPTGAQLVDLSGDDINMCAIDEQVSVARTACALS